MKSIHKSIALGALATGVAACGGLPTGKLTDGEQAQMSEIVKTAPKPLGSAVVRLYQEGERNAVLNFNKVGITAMELGQTRIAEKAFDQSIQRIEAIYANNEQAKKAKSLFAEEKVKDFKGEPYERAMTYYYRGLLYLKQGDYQNARAAFLSADYQATVSDREEFAGNFAVMSFLAGWSSMCDGDSSRGRELTQVSTERRPALKLIPPSSRFLAVVEAGIGPIKAGEGKHKEMLVFKDAPGGEDKNLKFLPPATMMAGLDGASIGVQSSSAVAVSATYYSQALSADDLYFQASTRGGRPVQGILDGKAQFKDAAKTTGDVALALGTGVATAGILDHNSDMAGLGAAIGLIGLLAQAASDAAKPAADTRTWSTLPRNVYLAGGEIASEANPEFKVEFDGVSGLEMSTLSYWGKHGNCAVAWGRTRRSTSLPDTAPIETSSQPRDKAFRASLVDLFSSEEERHEN